MSNAHLGFMGDGTYAPENTDKARLDFMYLNPGKVKNLKGGVAAADVDGYWQPNLRAAIDAAIEAGRRARGIKPVEVVRIPTSEVPELRLRCFYMSVHRVAGKSHFDLVDPDGSVSGRLQGWLSERDDQGNPTLRHLVIEDRAGEHRFVAQSRGQIASFMGTNITFETVDSFDRVKPNPGVVEMMAEMVPE